MLALLGSLIVSFFFDTSTELTPDHTDAVTGTALLVALLGGIVTLAALLYRRSRHRGGTLLSALGLGLVVAALLFLDVMSWGAVVATQADFAAGPIARWRGMVPISGAHVTYSKGAHYHATLLHYGTDVTVGRADYLAAFGKVDAVRPSGWCLRAVLERDGAALRIAHGSMAAMPVGSVVRCPPATPRPGR